MITDPKVLHRIVELTAELEELLQVQTTFLHGDSGNDIRAIIIADRETTDAILGDAAEPGNLN